MSQHQNEPEPNGLDDRFADWVDGRLEEHARRELEAELARDPELRLQAEEYRATVRLLRKHLVEESEPPADLVTGVLARVRRERSPFIRLLPMIASLSAAAALVLVVFLLNQPHDRGMGPAGDHGRSNEVAKSEVGDHGARPKDLRDSTETEDKYADDTARKQMPRFKKVPDEEFDLEAEQEAEQPQEAQQADRLLRKDPTKAPAPDKAPAPTKAPLTGLPGKARGKAPTPGAPTAPAEPRSRPQGGGEKQRLQTRRFRSRAGRRPAQDDSERQLVELRRIAAQVFAARTNAEAKTAQNELDRKLDLKPGADARDKHKADTVDDVRQVAPATQVPVVVVQVAAPTAGHGLRAEKENKRQQEGQARPDRAQGFLGYLRQQPQSWQLGNRILHQARALDVTDLAAQAGVRAAPQTVPGPERKRVGQGVGGAGAVAGQPVLQPVLQPGDQLLLVSGGSREVEVLFQQLKTYLGRPRLDVAVQQLPRAQLPAGGAAFGTVEQTREQTRKQTHKTGAAQEMRFYLLLRPATPEGRR